MANIYKAMAPFWVEVLILSPEDTAIFLNSRQDKNGEKYFCWHGLRLFMKN